MAFRLQGKHLSLTYPRCNGSREELLTHLREKCATWGIKYWAISQEAHEDGGNHLHAAIGLNRKCDIRNASLLDFQDSHGNYQAARDPAAWVKYVLKEDTQSLTGGDLPSDDTASKKRALASMHTATTETEFFDAAKDACGVQFFTMYDKLSEYANKKFKRELPPYTPRYTSFTTTDPLDQWISGSLAKPQVKFYTH